MKLLMFIFTLSCSSDELSNIPEWSGYPLMINILQIVAIGTQMTTSVLFSRNQRKCREQRQAERRARIGPNTRPQTEIDATYSKL